MESEDGCARAGRHAAVTLAVRTSSSARSPLCPQASPGQRPHHRRTCSAAASPRRGGGSDPDVCTQARGIAHTVHYDPACSGKGQKRAHGPRGPSAGRSGGGPRPETGLGGGLPPRPFQCV